MGKTVDLGVGVHLSLASLAREFGSSRDTVLNRLTKAAVRPSGKKGGHPVYRLAEALPALHDLAASVEEKSADPDKMQPFERHAHYKAEHEKLRLQQEMGQLVPQLEVEQEFARLAKIFTQKIQALPDECERDMGVPGPVVQFVEKKVDAICMAIYAEMTGDDGDESVLRSA